ncbi:MAG: exopolysaccharide Pel transporter PelG [Planctomycetota bacterium]
MAGIGFELKKLITLRPGLTSKVQAYAAAGLISSGPWIMTAVTLFLVSLFGDSASASASSLVFRSIVTYAFAFSLITVGAVQMAVTRWIADLLYKRQYEKILPAFTATFAIVGTVQTVVGISFSLAADLEFALGLLATGLYLVISLIWLALIWLTVIREYNQILLCFCLGTIVSVLLMAQLGQSGELNAFLGSYAAGQALTLVLLIRLLVRGMEAGVARDFGVWNCAREYPSLIVTGLFYTLAIWIDKLVFWFGEGVRASHLIYFHPIYDTCCFLAYTTVIPALAINLIHLETEFYKHYKGYYTAILGHLPLSSIEERRNDMMCALRAGMARLLKIQGGVSVATIVLAPYILDALGLPETAARLFRLACLGAFFHILLLITILIQLYFDLRKEALISATVFLVLNGTLAWWSLRQGFEVYGLGYAIASLVSVTVAFFLLDRALEWLDYLTFTSQLRRS